MAAEITREALSRLDRSTSPEAHRALREAIADDLTLADGPVGAWKHAAAVYDDAFAVAQAHVLFTVKSPGAWLVSFHRRPYHGLVRERLSIGRFAKSPWICVRRELTPSVVSSPIELWNLKVRSYLKFARKAEKAGVSCHFVRSEDLILDQGRTLIGITDWLGVSVATAQEIADDTKRRGRTLDDLKRYYGDELWRKELDEGASDHVADAVDRKLTDRFGYTI